MNDRLLQLRKELKLSQEKFGERLGVTKAGISKIENGDRNITDTMMKLICSEFNVNEEWLRYGIGEMFNPNSDEEIEALGEKYNLDSISKTIIKVITSSNELERKVMSDVFLRCVHELESEMNKNNSEVEE